MKNRPALAPNKSLVFEPDRKDFEARVEKSIWYMLMVGTSLPYGIWAWYTGSLIITQFRLTEEGILILIIFLIPSFVVLYYYSTQYTAKGVLGIYTVLADIGRRARMHTK